MKCNKLLWWKYLLGRPAEGSNIIRSFLCRARNHPGGVEWWSSYGPEPDRTCKNCRDDLGCGG